MSGDPSETWTDEDTALVQYEALPQAHPVVYLDVLRLGLQRITPAIDSPIEVCFTPESRDAWGDFSGAIDWANGPEKMSTTALWGHDGADVAYVRLVRTEAWLGNMADQTDVRYATLVWRPDLEPIFGSSWKLHQIGVPAPTNVLHRPAFGTDPRLSWD